MISIVGFPFIHSVLCVSISCYGTSLPPRTNKQTLAKRTSDELAAQKCKPFLNLYSIEKVSNSNLDFRLYLSGNCRCAARRGDAAVISLLPFSHFLVQTEYAQIFSRVKTVQIKDRELGKEQLLNGKNEIQNIVQFWLASEEEKEDNNLI